MTPTSSSKGVNGIIPHNYMNEHRYALRFARKEDATLAMLALYAVMPNFFNGSAPMPLPRIAEHGWPKPETQE